jgi:hypothetical protein
MSDSFEYRLSVLIPVVMEISTCQWAESYNTMDYEPD